MCASGWPLWVSVWLCVALGSSERLSVPLRGSPRPCGLFCCSLCGSVLWLCISVACRGAFLGHVEGTSRGTSSGIPRGTPRGLRHTSRAVRKQSERLSEGTPRGCGGHWGNALWACQTCCENASKWDKSAPFPISFPMQLAPLLFHRSHVPGGTKFQIFELTVF